MRSTRVLFFTILFFGCGEISLLAQTLPNDPLFAQQWHHLNNGAQGGLSNADLDAELAWAFATGGLTPAGDTIVVAVIDGGLDQLHPDLAANLWRNYAEIPNDGIDNDQNGYIDDVRGWNVLKNSDEIGGLSAAHGTPVSGIIGARGNNGMGGSGVNWTVKIMFVATSGTVADVLSAYEYIWQARRRYNRTNGKEGAFVVAINNSFGTNFGQPAQAPLWCAAFDSLGAAGILSVAATANAPIDVDVAGDLPTTCPSDYLISVTSLARTDQKALNAAWGKQHIDLGAYGDGVFSTAAVGSHGTFSGTSFAAPMVSGAVALLYSAPCPKLIAEAQLNPAAAALRVKKWLLESVTPNPALLGITLSGGRLNLASLLETYQDECPKCPAPFSLEVIHVDNGQTAVSWKQVADNQSINLRWREIGTTEWKQESQVKSPFLLPNLQPCTDYEFAVKAFCNPASDSDWSPTLSFRSSGCCVPPAKLQSSFSQPTSVELLWTQVPASAGYTLRFRPQGTANWTFLMFETHQGKIENLKPCTHYEVAVQTLCDALGGSDFGESVFFKTSGCGPCTDVVYCLAKSEQASDEWITAVQVGGWSHVSGIGGAGYQNFTASSAEPLQLFSGMNLPATVTPGFVGQPFKELFRIFVDFNADGDFDDADELAFDPGFAHNGPMSSTFVVPPFHTSGLVRMRVMMKFASSASGLPKPCETFGFGQVEDYCVELRLGGASPVADFSEKLGVFSAFPQPATQQVTLLFPLGITPDVASLQVWDATGRVVSAEASHGADGTLQVNTSSWPSGIYQVRVMAAGRIFQGKIVVVRQL